MNRRNFLKKSTFVVGVSSIGGLLSACSKLTDTKPNMPKATETAFLMPEESEPHAATWMAFGATAGAWGTTGAYGLSRAFARADLMRIALNLSRFEAVNMLVSPTDMNEAQQLLAQLKTSSEPFTNGKKLPVVGTGGAVSLIAQSVNDLWVRDTGAVFVHDAAHKWHGVNFHFNGWGQEDTGAKGWERDADKAANGIEIQPVNHDQKIADFILQRTATPIVDTWLVLEGGGIEVDGEGTAICTESCILNKNRNPNRSKKDVEAELARVLGVTHVIWLPGLKAQDITDGHIDFYARFIRPTEVVYGLDNDPDSPEFALTHEHEAILKKAVDAKGRRIRITPLIAPDSERVADAVIVRNNWAEATFNEDAFAAGYIGFYAANGCIVMQQFGDTAADKAAFDTIAQLYPDRIIMQLPADGLANGGGTVHCATQQQPK